MGSKPAGLVEQHGNMWPAGLIVLMEAQVQNGGLRLSTLTGHLSRGSIRRQVSAPSNQPETTDQHLVLPSVQVLKVASTHLQGVNQLL